MHDDLGLNHRGMLSDAVLSRSLRREQRDC